MASVCLYFQIHQPLRLRRYSVFDAGEDYFDEQKNADICRKVAEKCYLPVCDLLLEMLHRHEGRFRFALSVTGSAIEQFEASQPKVIEKLQQLAFTGRVEMLGESYYHSLAFLHSPGEFAEQVKLHRGLMLRLFAQDPKVFRGTELVYSNDLARYAADGGYLAILAEGADELLGARSCNVLYHPPGVDSPKILLKNFRLSDDIAFRFSNRAWPLWPLTADRFARFVSQINGYGDVCNLFIDLETFGEHQWQDTGIFEFLRYLPEKILDDRRNDFLTPCQVARRYPAGEVLDVPQPISWADTERDLSAWTGNAMQDYAMRELFKLEPAIKASDNPHLLHAWRHLTASDHFYYMSTKYFADGDVHKYFSPYESPYDSYINFMNVLDNLASRARG